MIIREDDFDPRYKVEQVKFVHEMFLGRNLTHTIALQMAVGGQFVHKQEVIDYVKSTGNWDIQLHGWNHEEYHKWPMRDIARDLFAAIAYTQKLFGVTPKIFYPPWNGESPSIEAACKLTGLEFNNKAAYIIHYLREPKKWDWVEAIYFHAWEKSNLDRLPKLLDKFKKEEK